MATVNGSVTDYVTADYLEDQGDYIIHAPVISFGVSASANSGQIVYGGATTWANSGTWAGWPFSNWDGGIQSDVVLGASATGGLHQFGTATANIVSAFDSSAGFLINGSGTAGIVVGADATAELLKLGSATCALVLGASAAGFDQDQASATAGIVLDANVTASVTVTGVSTAGIELGATGSAVLVIASASATGDLVLGATALGSLVRGSDPRRTYFVDSETRAFLVLPDSRVTVVPSETRIQKIYEES